MYIYHSALGREFGSSVCWESSAHAARELDPGTPNKMVSSTGGDQKQYVETKTMTLRHSTLRAFSIFHSRSLVADVRMIFLHAVSLQ